MTPYTEKQFATARAQAALRGQRLVRSDPLDGDEVLVLIESDGSAHLVQDVTIGVSLVHTEQAQPNGVAPFMARFLGVL